MLKTTVPEVSFITEAVREAAGLASRIQYEMGAFQLTKGDLSPVTVADFAVQAWIGYRLSQRFPQDPLVAEEDAAALREPGAEAALEHVIRFVREVIPKTVPEEVCKWIDHGKTKPGRRFWTLDPVDGTKGFLRGEQYAVAMALIEDGRVQIGALGCPNLGEKNEKKIGGPGSLAVAVQGEGAWRRPLTSTSASSFERLHVSGCKDPAEACFLGSVETSHTDQSRTQKFLERFGTKVSPRFMDSQAKHVVLASGGGDLFFYLPVAGRPDFRMKIWDVAPGSIVIE